jgi:hypothetical protein
MHYRELINQPRWEDMDIEYINVSIKMTATRAPSNPPSPLSRQAR